MGDLVPIAKIVHSMPRRSRLRIADRRGDDAFFASLATTLSAVSDVYKVDVTPLTGSVLIEHSGPLARIGVAARDAGLFAIGEAPEASDDAHAIEFDSKLLVLLGLVGAALWQMSREKIFPPAITLLWYALQLGSFAPSNVDAE